MHYSDGEHAARIRDVDTDFFSNRSDLMIHSLKRLRNRIVHTYTSLDDGILKEILLKDIPMMKKSIEEMLPADILDNPYQLYEIEYEDFIKRDDNGQRITHRHKGR